MKRLIFLVMLMVVMCVGGVQAKVINQSNGESFKTYEIQRGETLSEIAWVLGVSMKKLARWNPKVLQSGIRNIQPGTVLKYKTDKDLEGEVLDSQEEIRGKIQELKESQIRVVKETSQTREEVKKQGGETRKEVRGQGQDTRQKVSSEAQKTRNRVSQEGEATRKIVDSKGDSILKKIESTKEELAKDLQDSGKRFWVLLVILAGIVLLLLFIVWILWGQRQEKGLEDEPEDNSNADTFNQEKLAELEEVDLYPEQNEEEINFTLSGYQFKASILHDPNRGYRSFNFLSDQSDYIWNGDIDSLKKSLKRSLKKYLWDQEGDQHRVKEAMEGGKIKKI